MLDGVTPFPAEFAARYRRLGWWEDRPLFDGFTAALGRYSGRVALVDDDGPVTYGQLDERSAHLARVLLDLGLRPLGRFEPTSRMCSACGAKDAIKPLHVRAWQCQGCGTWLDRDINAAINVARAAGLAVSAYGARVRPGAIPARRGEAGTLRGTA